MPNLRRMPYPVTNLTGGLNVSVDAVFLADSNSPDLNNIRFDRGLVKNEKGFSAFLADVPAAARPMHFANYKQYDASEYLIMITMDHAYKWTGAAWSLISTDPGPAFTGDEDDIFWSTTFDDYFIVTNGKDVIYKWTGAVWSALTVPANLTAKFVHPFYNVLVLGFTFDTGVGIPYRVQWSDTGDPETWTGGNSGYLDLLDTQDFITALVPIGDRLFIFKEKSIWELLYTGASGTSYFEARMVVSDVGTVAGKTAVNVGGSILFYGTDRVYSFDGLNVTPLSNPLFPLLHETGQSIINQSMLHRAIAVFQQEIGDYIIALPTYGDDPDLILKYNVINNSWAKRSKDVVCFGFNSQSDVVTTWGTAVGAWNAVTWDVAWKTYKLPPGSPTVLYGDPDGSIEEDKRLVETDGITAEFVTKDFVLASECRWLGLEVVARGEYISIIYSTDQGRTWSYPYQRLILDENDFESYWVPVDETSFQIRFRIRSYGYKFEIKMLWPWYVARQRTGRFS